MNYLILVNKKYSLDKEYIPSTLTIIDNDYCFERERIYELDKEAYSYLIQMIYSAKKDGVSLKICSAYRSYDYQESLFQKYVARDGIELASTYSARPGHSEHQTGLAIDFIEQDEDEIFDITDSHRWLVKNAYKYGYIMRYPKGKEKITGYKYEPWHYRYVGVENAAAIFNDNVTLEEYLGEK